MVIHYSLSRATLSLIKAVIVASSADIFFCFPPYCVIDRLFIRGSSPLAVCFNIIRNRLLLNVTSNYVLLFFSID